MGRGTRVATYGFIYMLGRDSSLHHLRRCTATHKYEYIQIYIYIYIYRILKYRKSWAYPSKAECP